MIIDKIIIKEFQALYREKFKKDLGEQEARIMLRNLVTMLDVILDISVLHEAFEVVDNEI